MFIFCSAFSKIKTRTILFINEYLISPFTFDVYPSRQFIAPQTFTPLVDGRWLTKGEG